ncbi:MAG: hypothetical protein U5L45_03105 [Saprospiraceae bacterium]|nr:hypothetical protein [Saprospiraceae bacterium]
MFRFWASPKIETHLPCFTSEASYKNEIRTICYTLQSLGQYPQKNVLNTFKFPKVT